METLILLFAIVYLVILWMALASRLGYSPAVGLLTVIPLLNVIVISYLAFAESPYESQLRRGPRRGAKEDDYPEFFRGLSEGR